MESYRKSIAVVWDYFYIVTTNKNLKNNFLNLKSILLVVLCFANTLASAQREIDSLLQIMKQSQDTVELVDAINQVSFLLRSSNPDSTLLLSIESELLAEIINYPLGVANAKMQKGIAHTSLGNYYIALKYFLEAKSTYEILDNQTSIASSLNNIGRVYNFIEDYDRALEHYKESATLFAELKELTREGSILNNIGYIYKIKGDYDQSLQFLQRALERSHEVKNERNEIYPTYNIGSVYMLKNQPDSAEKYLNKSVGMALKFRDQYILSLAYIDLGHLAVKTNNIDSAQTYFEKAFHTASSTGLRSERRDAAKSLSEVYEQQGMIGKALEFHKLFKAADDSLFNRDIAKRMAFQEAESEFNRKQIEEEIRRNQEQLNQEKMLANAIWVRNSLLAGLFAMVLISYLLYMNFSRKRMANKALQKLNLQIEMQTEELRQANHEITVMNNNLETTVNRRTEELKHRNKQLKEYLSSNSHIVRAPLARILGLVDLFEQKDHEDLDFILTNLKKSSMELDTALRDINSSLSEEKV
jgi:tetratricopeptide (TPR) repeat protein